MESFRTIHRQASQGVRGFRGTRGYSGRNIYPTSVKNGYSGSVSPSLGHFKCQGFRQHQYVRPSAAIGNGSGGSVYLHSPGGTIASGARGGGAALHPVSRDEGLCSTVSSNINVVSVPPVATMEGRGDSTATSTTSAAFQDTATIDEMSLCGFRKHRYQSQGKSS